MNMLAALCLTPRRIYVIALLLGATATAALPPFFITPAAMIAFSGLLWLLTQVKSRCGAFITGFCFGFGHFVTGLYWISYSLLIDAEQFAWLIPFAVSLLPAVFACYIGIVTLASYSLGWRGWKLVLAFTIFWVAAEWLRAHLFTGFPWNLIGYIWTVSDVTLQPAAIFSIYGLSVLALLFACLPAVWIWQSKESSQLPTFIIALLVICPFLWGEWRLMHAPSADAYQRAFPIRLVQPNIPQQLKWHPDTRMKAFQRHIELTESSYGDVPPTLVIWPESALPFILEEEPSFRRQMAQALPQGSYLMTGAIRWDGQQEKIWNALQVMDDKGDIVASYDKYKLVPFGEFVPFREIFPFINKITPGGRDFSAGEGAETLSVYNIPPFSPMICYEAIFPEHIAKEDDVSPRWLLNVTNDGWFGDSTGPHQHFHMTRVRAVEQGLPLVRVANTGISGVIDEYGRVIAKLPLGQTGVIDAYLPLY